VTAPDGIEPVVGWRCWRVLDTKDGFALNSATNDTRWPARLALEASCPSTGAHDSPSAACSCGIYAARQPELVLGYFPPVVSRAATIIAPAILGYDTVVVVGLVSLWGRVVEGERGWRGRYAYPRELFVPSAIRHYRRGRGTRFQVFDSRALADALAELYDVPAQVTSTVHPRQLELVGGGSYPPPGHPSGPDEIRGPD
jgi:hypothetical protein